MLTVIGDQAIMASQYYDTVVSYNNTGQTGLGAAWRMGVDDELRHGTLLPDSFVDRPLEKQT